jgi:hypothetical protein
MSKSSKAIYKRSYVGQLAARLHESRRFIQIVAGPRQVGKTTLVRQFLEEERRPKVYASAAEPALKGREWIAQQWSAARIAAGATGSGGATLVLDEIQKIPAWAETIKRLWDEDTVSGADVRLVLLGPAPLLIQQGLTESLAGRFELLPVPHWSLAEMAEAFGWGLDRYLYFGGYPGAATLADDPERWMRYVKDALIETTISRDVLLLARVDKPALLRRLFDLACAYSGRVLSYQKMLGQLQDAGNTVTLAHYLDLLSGAGMVTGLRKYAGETVRQRSSSPKLQVLNTALMTAQSGLTPAQARADAEFFGRLVESAVGAHLANAVAGGLCELYYWRDHNREVDFVVKAGATLTAIEVKSGRGRAALPGMEAFAAQFKPQRSLLIGGDGIPLEEFLSKPVEHWVRP